MYAYAKRTDRWLGIKAGKVYNVELIKDHLFVHTDGYTVLFDEKDFEFMNPGETEGTV
jgi:hypothetical protein